MKTPLERFDFRDFLSYFFPGAIALTAILMPGLVLHELAPSKPLFDLSVAIQFAIGVALLTLSYSVGCLLSCTLHLFRNKNRSIAGTKENKSWKSDHLGLSPETIDLIKHAIKKEFGYAVLPTISNSSFYLCRGALRDLLPKVAFEVDRHGTHGIFRRNLVLAIRLWIFLGLPALTYWGAIKFFDAELWIAFLVVVGVVCVGFILVWRLFEPALKQGMISSRASEAREVFVGFLSAHQRGLMKVQVMVDRSETS